MKKLLIVDDSESFVELLQIMLEDEFELEFAKSSTQALNLIDANVYDALILDMSLPDYTGYWLGVQVRKKNTDVPIAILTNYDGNAARENTDSIDAKFWYKPNIATDKIILTENIKRLINNNDVEKK